MPIPDMIRQYNEKMGGVDLLDAIVALYRVLFRMKKWWWPFYAWSLSVSAVNAWRLRMAVTGNKEPFLSFLRELVMGMLAKHGKPTRGSVCRLMERFATMARTTGRPTLS